MAKKIVYIITNSDRAGAQQHVRSLIEHFSANHECELISGTRGYLSNFTTTMGIKTHIVEALSRNISPFDDFRAFRQIRRYLRENRPDIVHLHSAKAGFLGRLATLGLKTKVIYTVHGWAFSAGNTWLKRTGSILLEKLVSGLSDKIILVSEYDYRLALKYRVAKPDRLVVVHNGIKEAPARLSKPDNNEVFHMVSLVRFARQKNLPCMIKALASVGQVFRATIAGTGPLFSEIEPLLDTYDIRDKVSFVGEIEDVERLLCSGNVFILSSDWEGLPISMIEACRAGLPIVSTDVGGINEIIDQGENGLMVPANQPEELAEALKALIVNQDLAREMGKRSRKIFLEKFTEEKMLYQTQAIYHGCLNT